MEDGDLPRPGGGVVPRITAWVAWFGPGRLVVSAVSVVVVCAGVVWLVRSPPPSTESTLPYSGAVSAPPGSDPAPTTAATPVPSSTTPIRPVVHVAGAVRAPGVYELEPGARIQEALDAAGGPTADAAEHELNLAAPLLDGSRIHVPVAGEDVVGPLVVAPVGSGDEASGVTTPVGPIDLNRATVDELDALPGVGPATATAIVEDRVRNGPFVAVDDLDRVSGIGPAKLEALRDLVTT